MSAVSTLRDSMLGITTLSPSCAQPHLSHLCCLCQTSTCPCPHTPTGSWEVTCSGCSSVGERLWVQGCGWGATGGYLKSEGLAARELRSCRAGLQGSMLRPACWVLQEVPAWATEKWGMQRPKGPGTQSQSRTKMSRTVRGRSSGPLPVSFRQSCLSRPQLSQL